MYKLDMTKVLVLLVSIIMYVNYENYIKVDTAKLHREVLSLQTNIKRELSIQKSDYTKASLAIDNDKLLFDGKKLSYSKAMGEMQNQLTESAKNLCTINLLKWAQVPSVNEWYDKLRMNVSISCSPNNLTKFTNAMKRRPAIYVVENFRVTKDRNKPLLNVNMQLVAFRMNK